MHDIVLNSGPAVLSLIVESKLNVHHSQPCTNSTCIAFCRQIEATVVITESEVMAFWIYRNSAEGKVMRPVADIQPSYLWGSRTCVAVIAHCGRRVTGGHWLMFFLRNGNWYRNDSSDGSTTQENPFLCQFNGASPSIDDEYTIDILFFK